MERATFLYSRRRTTRKRSPLLGSCIKGVEKPFKMLWTRRRTLTGLPRRLSCAQAIKYLSHLRIMMKSSAMFVMTMKSQSRMKLRDEMKKAAKKLVLRRMSHPMTTLPMMELRDEMKNAVEKLVLRNLSHPMMTLPMMRTTWWNLSESRKRRPKATAKVILVVFLLKALRTIRF